MPLWKEEQQMLNKKIHEFYGELKEDEAEQVTARDPTSTNEAFKNRVW